MLRILALLIVICVVGFFLAKSFITRDYIVAAIEKSINSRVQIEEVDLDFYGLRGTVTLSNVIIAQRDENAEKKIPHDERDELKTGDIILESTRFNISLWEILSKEILLEAIKVDGVRLSLTLYENGDLSMDELFSKPGRKKKRVKTEKTDKFNAKDNEKFITTINEINLTDIEINLVVEKSQLRLIGSNVNLHLLDINVNPQELESVNDATIKLGGQFVIKSSDTGLEYGKIIANGDSNFTLFNTENGDLEPDMIVGLTVDSDSYLTKDIPAITKVEKAADLLKKIRITPPSLPEKVSFKNDQSVRVAYKLGMITLLDSLSVKVEKWELELLADSWLETGSDLHHFGVKLFASDSLSEKVGGFLEKSSKVRGLLGELTGEDSLLEDGRLALSIESKGELSDPKIRVKNKFIPSSGDLLDSLFDSRGGSSRDNLKEQGKSLLRGLLK